MPEIPPVELQEPTQTLPKVEPPAVPLPDVEDVTGELPELPQLP